MKKSIYALFFVYCSCLAISKTTSKQNQLNDNLSLLPTGNIEEGLSSSSSSSSALRHLDPVTRLLVFREMLLDATRLHQLESRRKREEDTQPHLPIHTRFVGFGYRLKPEDRGQSYMLPMIKAMRYGKKSSNGF